MRVACVLLPHFEVAVELSRHLEMAGRPVVVGGLPHERKKVRSCSPEAAAHGVAVGMSLRQARGLCPKAVFLPPDEEFYRETLDRVLQLLESFSPTVETSWERGHPARKPAEGRQRSVGHVARASTAPRLCPAAHPGPYAGTGAGETPALPGNPLIAYLDASGLERLFGPDEELGRRIAAAVEGETGLSPRVGLGSGPFVALAAALQTPPGSALVVREGEKRAFLAPLSVELLPCSQETLRRLGLLGLRTLGQLASLPAGALGEQFGPEGVELHQLARGVETRPLVPRELPLLLEEEVEIDPPTDGAELLLSAASATIERLVARMRSRYLACREVTLQVGFADGSAVHHSTTLHEPTDRREDLQRAAERLLARENQNPPLPMGEGRGEGKQISSLRLTLSGFGGQQGEQLGLFRSRADGLQRVRRAVRQAEEQFGEGILRPLAELEGESPPPTPIRVADAIGWPQVLYLEGRRERVRELCNRWRVREEWWRREVYRDYYRLITESGRLCVVFRDLSPPWTCPLA
ncbi:MAG: DNA polymerase Y family protein [Chloroflexota bacterium]